MILEVRQVCKKYSRQQAVENVSFSIKEGEIVGFLGPNGAGKSTTMKIITGCLPADSGDVFISGHSIAQEDVKAKAITGYLPENNPLYDEMYVAEYLEYVAGIYMHSREIQKRTEEIIDTVGLSPERHKKIGQLSKGYRQRVGLAQAFIHDPQLLVLDEPITGLDPNQIDEICLFLKEKGAGKAILFSSHTLSEVASVCSRVIIIHQGKIVLDRQMDEIEDLEKTFKELTRK